MRTVVTGKASSQLRMGDMASEIDDSKVTADSSGPTTATFSSTLAATPGRVEFVDGGRALAALYVVAHHAYIPVYPGFPFNTGSSVFVPLIYGHFGVAIFMVVSGYSLALAPSRPGWQLGAGGGGAPSVSVRGGSFHRAGRRSSYRSRWACS